MQTGVRLVLISLLSWILIGCASLTSFYPGAKKIVITEKPVAKNCQWLKKVTITNPGHAALTPYQHALLEQEEFNKIRNQAASVGGNIVYLSEYRIVKQMSKVRKPTQRAPEMHVLVGQVYKCPK
jgi:hypothetical protein